MSGPETPTQKDLLSLIDSLVEGLVLYESTLTPSKLSEVKTIESNEETNDINVEEELTKLSKLIFAHSTKIGIAFRAPVSINAAYVQLKETSQVFLVLIGVVARLYSDQAVQKDGLFGELYSGAIVESVRGLNGSFRSLLLELKGLDYSLKKGDVDESDRLVEVGKVWDCCKKLESLIEVGKLGLLKDKLKLSLIVVEDLIEEFEQWVLDPVVVDEDPFGFNDESDDEDDEEGESAVGGGVDEEVVEFGNKWLVKVKMVKLLFSSFIKSLPSKEKSNLITGEEIDVFNKEQNEFFNSVDDLVANVFLNTPVTELKSDAKKIYKQSELLIELLKGLNKGDDKKTAWLTVWQDKFLA